MRTFDYSKRFKRDYKLCQKQGKDMSKLHTILRILASGEPIPAQYRDHALKNNWAEHRDLHIEPDWILIYKIQGDEMVLLAATETHSHVL